MNNFLFPLDRFSRIRYTTSLIAVFKESNKFDPSDFQLAGPQRTGTLLTELILLVIVFCVLIRSF